ncbi:hypothetical protein NDU88_004787 [Pleurodeles waltl]|uniref:Uncharacterized protein n=1 Tax=Pleurodeles waltl TaxID=8319 RepID=A0AAV7WSX6_PLEWA|nr:hypothetical protein NDU88_004787 [Pleurodeles waltl]
MMDNLALGRQVPFLLEDDPGDGLVAAVEPVDSEEEEAVEEDIDNRTNIIMHGLLLRSRYVGGRRHGDRTDPGGTVEPTVTDPEGLHSAAATIPVLKPIRMERGEKGFLGREDGVVEGRWMIGLTQTPEEGQHPREMLSNLGVQAEEE